MRTPRRLSASAKGPVRSDLPVVRQIAPDQPATPVLSLGSSGQPTPGAPDCQRQVVPLAERRSVSCRYATWTVVACCAAASAGAAADAGARSAPERNSVPQITAPAPKMAAATQNPVV